MTLEIEGEPRIGEGDIEMGAINYSPWLDTGETLTGTPTVAEQTSTDLTISNVAVSTTTLTILGESVATGKALQFKVSGQKASTGRYRLLVTVATNSTPARTRKRIVRFACE